MPAHNVLDALCHPIINSYVKTAGMSHSLVEAVGNTVQEIEYIRKSLAENEQPDLTRYELDYLGKKH